MFATNTLVLDHVLNLHLRRNQRGRDGIALGIHGLLLLDLYIRRCPELVAGNLHRTHDKGQLVVDLRLPLLSPWLVLKLARLRP